VKKRYFTTILCMAFIALSFPAHAVDKQDLKVGLKTLPLLSKKITGATKVAVIFDPSNAASKGEADTIKSIIDGGLKASGGVTLSSVLVPVSSLGKLKGTKIAFITNGIKSSHGAIAAAAAKDSVLTISTDLSCVKSKKCILGVVSKPSIEIYYSKSTATSSNLSFSPAFTMLAKQI